MFGTIDNSKAHLESPDGMPVPAEAALSGLSNGAGRAKRVRDENAFGPIARVS